MTWVTIPSLLVAAPASVSDSMLWEITTDTGGSKQQDMAWKTILFPIGWGIKQQGIIQTGYDQYGVWKITFRGY